MKEATMTGQQTHMEMRWVPVVDRRGRTHMEARWITLDTDAPTGPVAITHTAA